MFNRWKSRRSDGAFNRAWRVFRKDKIAILGGIIIVGFCLIAALAPIIAPFNPNQGSLLNRLEPPGWIDSSGHRHILGTDALGRDILSRVIYGSRISILVGLLVISFSLAIGITMGLISGYFGGLIDTIIQRVVDTLLAFPYLIFALAIMAALGPGFFNLVLALMYKEWVISCRIIRGDVLAAKEENYVEAARALGASWLHIIFRDLLPNVFASALVVGTLRVGWVIIMEASLSFLGLGVQPPTATWGGIVSGGRDYIFRAWWITTFAGLAILILVLAINLFGEGLRDALDPRMSNSSLNQ